MTAAAAIEKALEDERRYQRVKVDLVGRYMLADRQEYACQIKEMSPGSATLITPATGEVGSRVVAYIDHLGRIEGTITRHVDGGFSMRINAGARKRDKLAAQLTWHANRHILNLPEDRRHERVTPESRSSEIRLPNGQEFPCRIIDISLSGAAVSCIRKPAIGSPIMLGQTSGRVVRHLENGFAIEFSRIQQNGQTKTPFRHAS